MGLFTLFKPAIPLFHALSLKKKYKKIRLWTTLSASVILVNKHILNTFPFPMILTTWHLALSALGTQVFVRNIAITDQSQSVPISSRIYLCYIIPIGFLFSLNLIFNNIALMYLNVAFIQMFKVVPLIWIMGMPLIGDKSVGPVMVLFAGWLAGLYMITFNTFMVVSVICFGVMISCYGEIRLDTNGVFIQYAAIVLEAVRLTLMEKLLSRNQIRMNPLLSLYYFAPICAAFCLLFALIFEGSSFSLDQVYNTGLWILLCNGVLAFLFNISSVFLISETSSLTLAICGVPKAMMAIVASIWFWRETVSVLQTIGFFVASIGVINYSMLDVKWDKVQPDILELDDEDEERNNLV
ncbi:hypothetical protein N7471_013614 [Penicillium samsonianum]|uniref:uncharacterized protein n=1 Tax=Penicillium samsonianum TaxID=1882272 RepID=UPI0025490F39|nr:uncharacterized protein N7471_013614 [Penicillium samsonianum]KAJ6118994.1 hypothetical protein N7471_013614 [Penicillium samsonianum]